MHFENDFGQRVRSALHELTAGIPTDTQGRIQVLGQLSLITREHIAACIQSSLNEDLQRQPIVTLRDRLNAIGFIESLADEFDLCVKCPKTGAPAVIRPVAERPRSWGEGRFAFYIQDDRGGMRKTIESSTVPEIRLLPAPQSFRIAVHAHFASPRERRGR